MRDNNAGNDSPPQDDRRAERYTIPNEASCSAEFPKGCIDSR